MELNGSPPQLWYLFLETSFDVHDATLADQLWNHLAERQAVSWQLALVQNRGGRRRVTAGLEERVHRLSLVLTPQVLLRASVAAWPEGTPRPLNVRRFEEAVLNRTKNGAWRL
jgi:hypothetical protein